MESGTPVGGLGLARSILHCDVKAEDSSGSGSCASSLLMTSLTS